MKEKAHIRMVKKLLHISIPHKHNNFKPLLFATETIVGLIALLVIVHMAFVADAIFVRHSKFIASVLPAALTTLANADRQSQGLQTLQYDTHLAAAAQLKANDMARRQYFSHNDPDGRRPWYWFNLAGYKYKRAGENLAIDFSESTDVETAWMNSPKHRANILKSQFTHVGIATAKGMYKGHNTTYVVQFFATPPVASAATPTIAKNIPKKTPPKQKEIVPSAPAKEKEFETIQPKNSGTIALTNTENTVKKADILGIDTKKEAAEVLEKTHLKQIALPSIAFHREPTSPASVVLGVETFTKDVEENNAIDTKEIAPEEKAVTITTTTPVSVTIHEREINGTLATLLSSPSQVFIPVLLIIFTLLLIIVAVSIFMHVRVRTVEEIIGAIALLAVVGVLLYVSAANKATVVLPNDVDSAQTSTSL